MLAELFLCGGSGEESASKSLQAVGQIEFFCGWRTEVLVSLLAIAWGLFWVPRGCL